MTNKTYDILKWIARFFLPAIGTLYFGLAAIWHFPYGEEVLGTTGAMTLFLNTILGISNAHYEGDGTLDIYQNPNDPADYNLMLRNPVASVAEQDMVTFKVIKHNMG